MTRPHLPSGIETSKANENASDGYGSAEPRTGETANSAQRDPGGFVSLPNSPTSFRRLPASMSRRTSNAEPPDERTSLLGAMPRSSRVRISSAHGSPHLSRNQSFAGQYFDSPSAKSFPGPPAPPQTLSPPLRPISLTRGLRRKYQDQPPPQPGELVGPAARQLPRTPGLFVPSRVQGLHLPRRTRLVRSVHVDRLGPRQHRRCLPRQGPPEQEGLLGPRIPTVRQLSGLDIKCPGRLSRRRASLPC